MPCPERNVGIRQRQQMRARKGKKKNPQEEKPNHVLVVTSYKQLLQAQTERVPRYSLSSILSVCPPGSFWPVLDQVAPSPPPSRVCLSLDAHTSLLFNRAHLEKGKAERTKAGLHLELELAVTVL